jgi:hypothetical protein
VPDCGQVDGVTTGPHPSPTPTRSADTGPLIASRRRRLIAWAVIVAIALTAAGALIFGPARGARNDIAHVRTDLHASRSGIFDTVRVLTAQLRTTEQSLIIQRRGLSVAKQSQHIARTTSKATGDLLQQTTTMVTTVRQVLTALGPLQQLRGKIDDVVAGVQAGVRLARSTLAVARQTLSTGRAGLRAALATLHTLRRSKAIQQQLLEVARETLRETRRIDQKLPTPPIFPAATTGSGR